MLIHKCKKGFVMLVQDTKFAGEIHDDQRYAQDSGAYTNGDLTSSGLSYLFIGAYLHLLLCSIHFESPKIFFPLIGTEPGVAPMKVPNENHLTAWLIGKPILTHQYFAHCLGVSIILRVDEKNLSRT